MNTVITSAAVALGVGYLDAKHFIVDDLRRIRSLITVKRVLDANNKRDRNSVWYIFEQQVTALGNAECYQFEGASMSWNEVNTASKRVAHYLLSKGLKGGDVIAFMMDNKMSFPIIWLACLSINVVPAFINTSLTGQGLAHCIQVSSAKLVLFDADLSSSIGDIVAPLSTSTSASAAPIQLVQWFDAFCLSRKPLSITFDAETVDELVLLQMSSERLGDEYRKGIKWSDPALLIFTSGTTGLPKAASCTAGRILPAFIFWTQSNRFTPQSRIYTPCPLYHSTASLLAIGASWYSGSTVIIGRKFSTTKFWDECRASNANTIQYVGETLRFLLSAPPSDQDKNHNVRLAYGNGCRPDVWNAFRNRFGVPIISEFFASTEGNGSLLNYNRNEFGAGAVGSEGSLAGLARKWEQIIVRISREDEEVERDEKGWCIPAAPDEEGELLIMIKSDSPFQAFSGYHGNESATQKKILRDVFVKGDMYFRTGDLLRKSADGFSYFADRLGDTYRWMSENVATTQVASVLGHLIPNPNVYGVLVPGYDGRAGCVGIETPSEGGEGSKIDLAQIAMAARKGLPKYAVPLFIRFVARMESTGTQKQQKVALRNEGIDPAKHGDPIYWLQGGKYVRFTEKDWSNLKDGKVRL